jgi:hypothetical protein
MIPRPASRSIHSQKVEPLATSSKVCWLLGTGSLNPAASETILETYPRVTELLGR